MPDLVDLLGLPRTDLEQIFARSAHWVGAGRSAPPIRRAGRRVATIFAGPAFRTRLAFDTAIDSLGGHRVDLPLTLGEREPIGDTARILTDAVDAVVIRHGSHADVLELAQLAGVPVVNAMTDAGHPCEVISEAVTVLQRRGTLDGLRLTFVGEVTNVFLSWCELATHFDIEVTQVAPRGFEAAPGYLAELRERGARVVSTTDVRAGAAGADVLYTDGWPAAARTAGPVRTAFAATRITPATLELLAPAGVLMHCLPVARGNEVDAAAFAHPRSISFEAKANLAPSHTAIMEYVLGTL
jgi:ornithine carbamoyltransferase